MTSTTQPEQRLYDIAAGRKVADDRLPTPEEMKEAVSALGAVAEFFMAPIAQGVIQTANRIGPTTDDQAVTFEDVARLVGWADYVVQEAESIIDEAEKVMVIARAFLIDSAAGFFTDRTPFKDNGVLTDDPSWDLLRRRYGFGRPRG